MKKRWFNPFKKMRQESPERQPVVMPRADHELSRELVSDNALKVLYRLNKAGYTACLVGGSVRDILLERRPKDFDVATDATPEQVRSLFRNSRLIGRRFRLVHVYYPGEIIEVSTFRANVQEKDEESDEESAKMIRADNVYGTIEEDAWRRDFTVNALYYNIADFSVIDYTQGLQDLEKNQIRMIGDPVQRYHEDPVRLLRAIRLAAKLHFKIEEKTETPLIELAKLLEHVPPARLYDEFLKLFFEGNAEITFKRLYDYRYFDVLFPYSAQAMQKRQDPRDFQFIQAALQATDQRFHAGQSINPGFLLSVMRWPYLQELIEQGAPTNKNFFAVLHHAIFDALEQGKQLVLIPRRLRMMIRSVWMLQYHMERRRPKRIYRIFHHRYFRAAIDFMELRVQSQSLDDGIFQWWREFQLADEEQRAVMVDKLSNRKRK